MKHYHQVAQAYPSVSQFFINFSHLISHQCIKMFMCEKGYGRVINYRSWRDMKDEGTSVFWHFWPASVRTHQSTKFSYMQLAVALRTTSTWNGVGFDKFERLLLTEYKAVGDSILHIKSFRNVLTRVGQDALLALATFQEKENGDVDVTPMSIWRDARLDPGHIWTIFRYIFGRQSMVKYCKISTYKNMYILVNTSKVLPIVQCIGHI